MIVVVSYIRNKDPQIPSDTAGKDTNGRRDYILKPNIVAWQEMLRHPRIAEILEHREFRKLENYTHHGRGSRRAHCVDVASLVFVLSYKKDMDYVSATRGALLHDFFFYHRRFEGPRLHNFRHPALALERAREYFTLNAIEEDAILRHMWPVTAIPPKFPESALVSLADKIVAINELSRRVRYIRMLRMSTQRSI